MASFVAGQVKWNPALWLATRVGNMTPSCPPLFSFSSNKSFIDPAGQDGWILVKFCFLRIYGTETELSVWLGYVFVDIVEMLIHYIR